MEGTSPHPPDPQPSTLTTPLPSNPAINVIDPLYPANSLSDAGSTKRPRDARLLHMILASLGVTAYQERVPLQLMDFAYRYTSSTLQDALHLTSEGYGSAPPATGRANTNQDLSGVTLQSLRLSVASRMHYQFNPILPKEHFQELAQEKNRIQLPQVNKDGGLRLPPERYCLTGVPFGLRDEWDSEGEAQIEADGHGEDTAMNHDDTVAEGDEEGEDEAMADFVNGIGAGGEGRDEDEEL